MDISAKIRENGIDRSQAAAERYRETAVTRQEARQRQSEGETFPDAPEVLAARAARLIQRQGVSVEAVMESTRAEPLDRPAMHERILGVAKDLQAWSFLPRGVRAARTVARISLRESGREMPIGSGFLVSPRLLLTNHHVFPEAAVAREAFVEFDAQMTVDNTPDVSRRFQPDPDAFYVADAHLDFALVLIGADAQGRPPGEIFGWNRLSVQRGKLVVGEPVNIIGHPSGRLKEISIRENRLEARLEEFLQYQTDTEPGNSGSPVYNDQWEVTALHHSGVPATDERGRILRRDGQVWRPGDGDDAVHWISNEGVRISSILRHLAARPLGDAERALLAEMGPESGIPAATSAPATIAAPAEPGVATPPLSGPVGEATGTTPPLSGPVGGVAGTTPPPDGPGRGATGIAAPPSGPVGGVAAPAAAAPSAPPSAPPPVAVSRGPEGLAASEGAFGGGLHLIYLHGRGQEGRDPQALRRNWTAGLNAGLTRAGLATIDPADAWFPFYGDELVDALRPREAAPHSLEEIVRDPVRTVAPASEGAWRIYQDMLVEAADRTGMPLGTTVTTEGLGDAALRALGWLAAVTDLDRLAIAAIFEDVAAYLDDRATRDAVLNRVQRTLPDGGRWVVVAHSLGTVVAVDLLTRLGARADVRLLVTAGSPLGMDSVHHRLLAGGPKRPEVVADWLNVWSATDPVAVGCPLGDDWQGDLSEVSVVNAKGRPHDVVEYLGHPEVAAAIGAPLAR